MVTEAEAEDSLVRCDALKSMFDLILLFGMSTLVRDSNGEGEEQNDDEVALEDLRDDLMFELLECMDSDDKALRLSAAEGFAKLAVVGRLVDARVLQCLVVL